MDRNNARRTSCDVAQADHPPVRQEIDVENIPCSERKAPDTRNKSVSSPVCREPAGLTAFCAWRAAIIAARSMPSPASCSCRKFDENLLVLRAEDFDLRYVRHLQQARADVLDIIAQFAMSEAVRREAIDRSRRCRRSRR